jgi:hypothetical protein
MSIGSGDAPRPEDEAIFLAEGILSERLDVSIDEAISVLADIAVGRRQSLLETAQDIVDGTTRGHRDAGRPRTRPEHDDDPRRDCSDAASDGRASGSDRSN